MQVSAALKIFFYFLYHPYIKNKIFDNKMLFLSQLLDTKLILTTKKLLDR